MPKPSHDTRPCAYDAHAADELIADRGFAEAFDASLRLLGCAFVFSPQTQEFKTAYGALCASDLEETWPFGMRESLAEAAVLFRRSAKEDEQDQLRAYTRLFRGPGHLYAPPWGSVYMDRDQVLYGWTWVLLRDWMRSCGYAKKYEENDPEDQFGRLLLLACEVAKTQPGLLFEFLGDHLLCWSGRYLDLLADHAGGPTYEALAVLADATLEDIGALVGMKPAPRKLYR